MRFFRFHLSQFKHAKTNEEKTENHSTSILDSSQNYEPIQELFSEQKQTRLPMNKEKGELDKKNVSFPPVHADIPSDLGLPNFGIPEETDENQFLSQKADEQQNENASSAADGNAKLPSSASSNFMDEKLSQFANRTASLLENTSMKKREEILKSISDWPIIIPCSIFIIATWIIACMNLNFFLVCPWIIIFFFLFINSRLNQLKLQTENEFKRNMLLEDPFPDEETANWLNLFLEKVWPLFMERIVAVKAIPKLLPWFLNEYKPPGLSKLDVKGGFLGKGSPVLIKNMQVFRNSSPSEHVIMKMGVEIVFSKDSFLEFAAHVGSDHLLGLGRIPWKAFVTDVILMGDARLTLKLNETFPFVEELKFCFFSPPQLSLSVKIFGKRKMQSLDTSSMPLISTFVESTLKNALNSSLVHPNALIIDDVLSFMNNIIEIPETKEVKREERKELSDEEEVTCSKTPASMCLVEIIKAEKLIASDMNGSSDPYIKGRIGMAKFQSSMKRRTLNPTWNEEFMVPIASWGEQTFLKIHAMDHDKFNSDDDLGHCEIDLREYKDGERHEVWKELEGVNSGKLLLGITIWEGEDVIDNDESHKVKAESSNVARPKQLENMRLKRETSKRMESMKKGRSATMTRRPVNVGKTFHRLMPGVQVFTWSK